MRSFFQEKFQTKRFIKTKILWRLQLDLSRGHDFTVRVRVGQHFEKHAGQIEVCFFPSCTHPISISITLTIQVALQGSHQEVSNYNPYYVSIQ